MTATKLSVYNKALLLLGERKLSSDTEATERRYDLDTVYDQDAIAYCLELVKPRFAWLVDKITTPTTPAEHSLAYEYALPADYIALTGIWSDAELDEPIHRFIIEGRAIACDYSGQIYIRYVNSSVTFSDWTPSFAEVVSAYLAKELAPRVAPQKLGALEELFTARVQTAVQMEMVKEGESPRPQASVFTLTSDYQNMYNGALALLGLRQITSIDDDSERRSALDATMNSGAVDYLLELVKPKFSLLTVASTSSGTPSTNHDYDEVHSLPSDFLSIAEIHSSATMDSPVEAFMIEGASLYTVHSTIYLRYVQNAAATSVWTPAFKQLVSAYLADQNKHLLIRPTEVTRDPQDPYRTSTDASDKHAAIRAEYEHRLEVAVEVEGFKEPARRSSRSTSTLTDTWRRLYNNALQILGVEELSRSSDTADRRSKLDVALDSGAVEAALEDIGWQFAVTTSKITHNASLDPDWGHQKVYDKPADLHHLDGVYEDEFLRVPLKDYSDEGDYWYGDLDAIWVQYVKTSYLTAIDLWPQYFEDRVAAELAVRAGASIPDANMDNALRVLQQRGAASRNTDAMISPPQRIHPGSWVTSRGGRNPIRESSR